MPKSAELVNTFFFSLFGNKEPHFKFIFLPLGLSFINIELILNLLKIVFTILKVAPLAESIITFVLFNLIFFLNKKIIFST